MLLALIYPCIKLLHELGHAAATKVLGGEVHEAGVILVALYPLPYVDCSSASMFRDTHQRVPVGAAGMLAEMFLAALALAVWLNTEPGLVHACAYNVILIAGISTVLVNGNPLLRFDAYYILADLVGMPNLAARAQRHLGHLVQRYLYGVHAEGPPVTRSEACWFVVYGIAAFICRSAVTVTLIWIIAGKVFFFGVALALWALATMLVWPVLRTLYRILTSPHLRGHRLRATAATVATAAIPAVLIFGVPLPLTTYAQGIVRLPDGAELNRDPYRSRSRCGQRNLCGADVATQSRRRTAEWPEVQGHIPRWLGAGTSAQDVARE